MLNKAAQGSKTSSYGQALVIILLVMATALTIALSVVSRSITDVKVAEREEEAARAFSAAEAGIEQALITESSVGSTSLPGGALFSANVTTLAEGGKNFFHPQTFRAGEVGTIWFLARDGTTGDFICTAEKPCYTGNSIQVCWGTPGTPPDQATTPAVEVNIYYALDPAGVIAGDYSSVRVARGAYDGNLARRSDNSFTSPDSTCVISGNSYEYSKNLDFPVFGIPGASYTTEGGLIALRVRYIYNTDQGHPLAANVDFPGNGTLPSQGQRVVSEGKVDDVTRKIEVYKLHSDLPPIFDFGVFTGSGGLTK